MQAAKAALDPAGVLNPGVLVEPLDFAAEVSLDLP
jgi:hypothetical protein